MTLRDKGTDPNYNYPQPEEEYWTATKKGKETKQGQTAFWPPQNNRIYTQWLGKAEYQPQCQCVVNHNPEPLSCQGWNVRTGKTVPVNHTLRNPAVLPLCPAGLDAVKRLLTLWVKYEGRLRVETMQMFNFYHRRVVALTWVIHGEQIALTDEMIAHFMEYGTSWYRDQQREAIKSLQEREQTLAQTLDRLKAGQWISHRRPLTAELSVLIEGALDTGLLTQAQRQAVEANRKPVR